MVVFSRKLIFAITIAFIVGISISLVFLLVGDRSVTTKNVPPANELETYQEKIIAPSASLIPQTAISNSNINDHQLTDRARNFVEAWDSFIPNTENVDRIEGRPSKYQTSLKDYVNPGFLGNIENRVDSTDPAGVCPECPNGMEVIPGSVSFSIIESGNNQAYLVGQSLVTYLSGLAFNPRDQLIYQRKYGLLLHKQNGQWLVDRATATSAIN